MIQTAWIKFISWQKQNDMDAITTLGCFPLPGLNSQQASHGRLAKNFWHKSI